jgi:nucleolar protein 56
VARPLWADKGNDPQAVAEHLQVLADTANAAAFRFSPQPLPDGADLKVLHQAALLRVRKQLSASHAETDRILSQEVRAIDDLVRTANLLVERLREWYALHAPEATRLVTDAETLARLVADKGDRAGVLTAIDQAKLAESSLGSDLDPADMAVLRGFAVALAAVHDSWHALEKRVMDLMETVAPNVAHIAGPVIGARMIALSGGLDRLALWPAGTVQLLGAETALFRHIKEGTKPPKHGILFQHPSVHLAPPWQRGSAARILALATAKAAKADAFTRNDLRPLLAAEVKEGLERIAKSKAKPPMRKAPGWQRNMGPGAKRGPGQFSGQRRGPPAPRDDRGTSRGPPRAGGGYGGPPRDRERAPAPAPRFNDAPRDGPGGSRPYSPRPPEGAQGPPGGFGRSGPPRPMDPERAEAARRFDERNAHGPPRDDRGPPRGPGGYGGGPAGKPWKRKPQGAFRSDNNPARPPGKAAGDKAKDPTKEGF